MPISPERLDIYEQYLDQCLESESGVILISCHETQQVSIRNILTRVVRRSLYESCQIYTPGEPQYGSTIYERIKMAFKPEGIYLIRLPEPDPDLYVQIIKAAVHHKDIRINPATKKDLRRAAKNKHRILSSSDAPEEVKRLVRGISILLYDDTLCIFAQSAGFEVKEIPPDAVLETIAAVHKELPEKTSPQALDNDGDED